MSYSEENQARHYLNSAGVETGLAAFYWLNTPENLLLKQALEQSAKATEKIGAEQERLRLLLAEAKNDIERNARLFQIEYVENYLIRAEEIARKRIGYFKNIVTDADFERENEKCAADKLHWFEYYAWGYDPRARAPLSVVPFGLFPKQKELVRQLDDWVFNRRTSAIVEKSRDEGATELFVRWSIHNWRYRDEGFSVLLSTRKEDEIDTKKKKGTLFERGRFQIRLLPHWMLPKDFDRDKGLLPDKLIANPENGNAIQGEAPVERMGSGDRVTCALFDEFAFWRFAGYPQFASMSQTTDSILMISSVGGKLNQYADIAHDGVTPKFVLDWRDNPFKDKRWYDSLPFGYISPKMSKTTIAQEVDRNYDAAQPGKVWQCPEPYVFITQSEFLRPFKEAGLSHKFFENGKFIIPRDWRIIRTSDYGKSEGHEWSYLLGAQPTVNYPLHDTHFIFVARILEPTGILTAEAVKLWREWERDYGLRNNANQWLNKPKASYHSHEQGGKNKVEGEKGSLRDVLLNKYGESWHAWETSYSVGIEAVEEWWTPEDSLEQNPFRPELYGRCKLVFVAPDGEYQLAFNERLNSYFVTLAESEEGFNLARKQISAYHYPMSELGKAIKDMRPEKVFDDIIDAIRGYAVNWNRKPLPMSDTEKKEAALPEHLRALNINRAESEQQKERLIQSRVIHLGEIEKQNKREKAATSKYRPTIPKIRLKR